MFESLSSKFREALRKISGQATISEANISEAMEELKSALIDADVNKDAAEQFINDVKTKSLGREVLPNITPEQQIVKFVYDELVNFLGDKEAPLNLQSNPSVILLVGLHGSGKTTTSAKIASHLIKKGRKPMLAACDVYRPAAIDQLEILSKEINAGFYAQRNDLDVITIAKNALMNAKLNKFDTLIIDSAGRHQIDNEMIMELVNLKQSINPDEILLVADAALGQESASVAKHFNQALGITGVVLTKLDGDARGGAALSIRKVADSPIKFVGVGEKISDLEPFYPDRMASRILGMGDILSLVEKAAEEIDRKEAEKLQKKMLENKFDLDDLMQQIKQMKKMGGLESILPFLPEGDQLAGIPGMDNNAIIEMESLINSMTKAERQNPDIIDFSRKKRICKGSGRTIEELNRLLEQFNMMKKFMKNTSLLKKIMSGLYPSSLLGALGSGGISQSPFKRGSNYTPPKKKRKKRK